MQMNCPDNIFFFVTHSFKTVRFHELPLAIVTEITLFYSNFPVPFTIFDNIFRLTKYAINRSHLSITQKKTHSYINHSFSRQYPIARLLCRILILFDLDGLIRFMLIKPLLST